MNKLDEMQDKVMVACMENIQDGMTTLTQYLSGIGVPVEAILIDLWPKFENNIKLKLWDGKNYNHTPGDLTFKSGLTAAEVLEVAKRRRILKRKF